MDPICGCAKCSNRCSSSTTSASWSDIERGTGITAKGFDRDLTFMAAEIVEDQMYFNVVSRTGQTIDSGVITRRKAKNER